MNYRQFILLAVAVFFVLLFFKAPVYEKLYRDRVGDMIKNFPDESSLDLSERKVYRWGNTFLAADAIRQTIEEDRDTSVPFVLIPTPSYVKKTYSDVLFPEPIAFYYLTGFKATYAESPLVKKVNFLVFIDAGNFKVARVSPNDSNVAQFYNKY